MLLVKNNKNHEDKNQDTSSVATLEKPKVKKIAMPPSFYCSGQQREDLIVPVASLLMHPHGG